MSAGALQCGALCGLTLAVLPPPLFLAPLTTGARGQDPGWREYPAGQAPVSEPPAEEGRGGCLSVQRHVSVGMDAEPCVSKCVGSVGSGLNLTYPHTNHVKHESRSVFMYTHILVGLYVVLFCSLTLFRTLYRKNLNVCVGRLFVALIVMVRVLKVVARPTVFIGGP